MSEFVERIWLSIQLDVVEGDGAVRSSVGEHCNPSCEQVLRIDEAQIDTGLQRPGLCRFPACEGSLSTLPYSWRNFSTSLMRTEKQFALRIQFFVCCKRNILPVEIGQSSWSVVSAGHNHSRIFMAGHSRL